MIHRQIQLVTSDAAFAEEASAALKPHGFATLRTSGVPPAGDLILDLSGVRDAVNPLPAAFRTGHPVLCISDDDDTTLQLFTENSNVQGVFGRAVAADREAFGSAAATLLGPPSASIVGFLRPGAEVRSRTLTAYEQKDQCFEEVLAFVNRLDAFTDFAEIVVAGVWEMLMNALFDAAAQRVAPAADSRVRPVIVEYGSDGAYLAIAVQDEYGTLTRDTVARALARCHRRGPDQVLDHNGGAGIGLYILYNNAHQLHFTVAPGKRTRVLMISRVLRRYKDFEGVKKSLSFTCEGPR